MADRSMQEFFDEVEANDFDPTIPLFTLPGVTFEVVAKIRAKKGDKEVATLVGPILLTQTDSLYRAMFLMSVAGEVLEFDITPEDLLAAASQIASELAAGKTHKWTKVKGK